MIWIRRCYNSIGLRINLAPSETRTTFWTTFWMQDDHDLRPRVSIATSSPDIRRERWYATRGHLGHCTRSNSAFGERCNQPLEGKRLGSSPPDASVWSQPRHFDFGTRALQRDHSCPVPPTITERSSEWALRYLLLFIRSLLQHLSLLFSVSKHFRDCNPQLLLVHFWVILLYLMNSCFFLLFPPFFRHLKIYTFTIGETNFCRYNSKKTGSILPLWTDELEPLCSNPCID